MIVFYMEISVCLIKGHNEVLDLPVFVVKRYKNSFIFVCERHC